MSKLSSLVVSVCLLALAGCSGDTATKDTASVDMCSHCAGTQMVTADGKCEACAMVVDVCTVCPGEQTLVDGKCSACSAKVPVKT